MIICLSILAFPGLSWPMDHPSSEALPPDVAEKLNDELLWAATYGHLKEVRSSLAQGAQVETLSHNGLTPLMLAAGSGHKPICKLLIKHNAQVNAQSRSGRTPLLCAAGQGHKPICKLLIKHNAQIDARDLYNQTPLSTAAFFGHELVCKLLIKHNAQVDARDDGGMTPLANAAFHGHELVCKLLIKHNAQVDARDDSGMTPLANAACRDHKRICKLLIDYTLRASKQAKDAAIALISLKRFNKAACMGALDRHLINQIARQIWEPYRNKKQELIAQIKEILDSRFELGQELMAYVHNQLESKITFDQNDTQTSPKCTNCLLM